MVAVQGMVGGGPQTGQHHAAPGSAESAPRRPPLPVPLPPGQHQAAPGAVPRPVSPRPSRRASRWNAAAAPAGERLPPLLESCCGPCWKAAAALAGNQPPSPLESGCRSLLAADLVVYLIAGLLILDVPNQLTALPLKFRKPCLLIPPLPAFRTALTTSLTTSDSDLT